MFKKKKDSDGTKSGFLKRSTIGTSNEISFSVLDAKSDEAPDATSPEWEFPQGEVKSRKKKRIRSRRTVTIAIVCAVMAVLVAFGWVVMQGIRAQIGHVGDVRYNMEKVLEAANGIQPFADKVQQQTTADLQTLAQGSSAQHDEDVEGGEAGTEAAHSLAKAAMDDKSAISSAMENVINMRDKEAANDALSLANSCNRISEIGTPYLKSVQPYITQYRNAVSAEEAIMTGDSLARDAAVLAQNANDEDMEASIQKSEESKQAFAQARDQIAAMIQAFPALSDQLQPWVNYVQLRLDSQDAAIEADEAYLDVDSQALREANEAANQLEANAVEAYQQLQDAWPEKMLSDAFVSFREGNAELRSWNVEYPNFLSTRTKVSDYLE